ncbi:MAG TPA: hypothetical protein VFG12_04785, partial [Rhodopila sp.]|nr:hypothetical protein [Rhodopila sp.]
GPGCAVQNAAAGRARAVCGGVAMDVRWAVLSPRVTAGPLMGALRRLVARAEAEDLQEHWLEGADGRPSTWRVMSSQEPAYVTAVSVWVEGKAVRPGLAMRKRMALDSLFGASVPPVVVAVTPVADWAGTGGAGVKAQETGLASFLRGGVDWDRVVRVLAGG